MNELKKTIEDMLKRTQCELETTTDEYDVQFYRGQLCALEDALMVVQSHIDKKED